MEYHKQEIVLSILRTALNGATKTKIMHDAYLSDEKAKDYLKFLQSQELLKYDRMRGIYTTTKVAKSLLKTTEGMDEGLTTMTRQQDDDDAIFGLPR